MVTVLIDLRQNVITEEIVTVIPLEIPVVADSRTLKLQGASRLEISSSRIYDHCCSRNGDQSPQIAAFVSIDNAAFALLKCFAHRGNRIAKNDTWCNIITSNIDITRI